LFAPVGPSSSRAHRRRLRWVPDDGVALGDVVCNFGPVPLVSHRSLTDRQPRRTSGGPTLAPNPSIWP
jgi:hypothetical protein